MEKCSRSPIYPVQKEDLILVDFVFSSPCLMFLLIHRDSTWYMYHINPKGKQKKKERRKCVALLLWPYCFLYVLDVFLPIIPGDPDSAMS